MSASFPLAESELIALFCEASLHGAYTMVYLSAIYLLGIRRRGRMTRQAKIMLVLATLQWCLSTVHVFLAFVQDIRAFIVSDAGDAGSQSSFNDNSTPIVIAEIAIEFINMVIGDSILIWRAWVIWGKRFWTVSVPICLLLGTLGTSLGLIRQMSVTPDGDTLFDAPNIEALGTAFGCLTLCTNIGVTGMIVGRVMWQSRRISKALGHSVGGGSYQAVVILVAESGAVYSLATSIALIIFITGGNAFYVVFDMVAQLTGIIPTLILVLVSLGLTHGDAATAYEQSTIQLGRSTRSGLRPTRTPYGTYHTEGTAQSPELKSYTIKAEAIELGSREVQSDTSTTLSELGRKTSYRLDKDSAD